MTIFIFLEYPLTTSAECISLIIWVPLVVIQDRMFGHNRGIVIGNMNTLFWWMCADKRNIKVINHWLQLSPSHILFFPFPYALHLFFLSRCDKIPRIGKNWTSKFLTNNHLKALLILRSAKKEVSFFGPMSTRFPSLLTFMSMLY